MFITGKYHAQNPLSLQLTLCVFIQVAGVIPVSLLSDLSQIFLFKLTFKKGEEVTETQCFNSDKAIPVNKARKASLEPVAGGWAFPMGTGTVLLAATGTVLPSVERSLLSPLKESGFWQVVECSACFEKAWNNLGKCFTVSSGEVKFFPVFHIPGFLLQHSWYSLPSWETSLR